VSDGENTANYQNPEYDKLFAQLKSLDDGPEKQAVIDKMVKILQQDAPWSFGFYPYASVAIQQWMSNSKPAILIRDHGRYVRLDAEVSYTLAADALGAVTLYMAGRNLLDQDIRFATSYTKAFAPQPGRSFLVGLRAQF
jgi:outer membrane receptor protein involved in Fe transport